MLTCGAVAALAAFPALTMVLVVTNASHGLMWSGARLVADGPLQALAWEPGPWFWVVLAYSYGVLLLGAGPVISSLLGHHRLYRMQGALLLAGVLVPWVASGLNLPGEGRERRTYNLVLSALRGRGGVKGST